MMLSMFWSAPAMQYSRVICDTNVPDVYRSIWKGAFVGVAAGVAMMFIGVVEATELPAATGFEPSDGVADADRSAAAEDAFGATACTAGTITMTDVQPTTTMSRH